MVSKGIIDCIEGYVLLETNEIFISDYRSYLFDINFEEYFGETFSKWDKMNRSQLDLAKRSHQEQFIEIVEE